MFPPKTEFSAELQKALHALEKFELLKMINDLLKLESEMVEGMQNGAHLREGNLKTSFIYLLIDPRILGSLVAEFHVCFS